MAPEKSQPSPNKLHMLLTSLVPCLGSLGGKKVVLERKRGWICGLGYAEPRHHFRQKFSLMTQKLLCLTEYTKAEATLGQVS